MTECEASNEEFKEQDSLIKSSSSRVGGICSNLLQTKSSRLTAMLLLIIVYFLAEIIVGKFKVAYFKCRL